MITQATQVRECYIIYYITVLRYLLHLRTTGYNLYSSSYHWVQALLASVKAHDTIHRSIDILKALLTLEQYILHQNTC